MEKIAAKAHTSLSKFIIAAVDKVIDEVEFRPRSEVVREMETPNTENKSLGDDLKQKEIVLGRNEAEPKRYRAQTFTEEDYHGMRRYSKELVDILKARGQVASYRLLEALGVDPRDSDLVKAVSKLLEELEGYGMIKKDGRSWKWIS